MSALDIIACVILAISFALTFCMTLFRGEHSDDANPIANIGWLITSAAGHAVVAWGVIS